MDENRLRNWLQQLRAGRCSIDELLQRLRTWPTEQLGYATIDHHRPLRCGFTEVIFCPGKSDEQVAEIFERLVAAGGEQPRSNVLATRAHESTYRAVAARVPQARYHELARAITFRGDDSEPIGAVAIVTAGTSDLPVAEEARVTAEIMGSSVRTYYDLGVAGLHRLFAKREQLAAANVVVVAAGMEGALPSVVGGMVDVPVIAVPTSVGYGASFGGVAALLAMLNSCAAGVTVVNIDAGFKAGYVAAMINRMVATRRDR